MFKRIIYITFLLIGILNAATITSDKDSYTNNESILVNFSEMTGLHDDWIGIYRQGSESNWGNVVAWHWTGDTSNGTVTFENLPVGQYEIRAFYNNSYNLEANKSISVTGNVDPATVTTTKDIYTPDEAIDASYTNMSGNQEDWIAIYPKGSANTWGNMIQWAWVPGTVEGTHQFTKLPVGEYEVRVFFNNSFNLEASHEFSVQEAQNTELSLALTKNPLDPFELIHVEFNNFRGEGSDWIGIFPVGADNQKESAIEWRDAKSLVSGTLTFNGLPAGTYEARAYFATLHKKTITFTVQNQALERVLYEDAEDGIDPQWVHYAGIYPITLTQGANGSAHAIRTRAYWSNGTNPSGYYFPFANSTKKLKFLDLDLRIGVSSHIGNFGVVIDTKNGTRRIIWATWMNHQNGHGGNDLSGNATPSEPFTNDGYLLMYPGPTDYYLATRNGNYIHYKINVEETLRRLEPDNELLRIRLFTTAGGDYDNLALTSQ